VEEIKRDATVTSTRTDEWYKERRRKRIKNVKSVGCGAMYIGCGALMASQIQPIREKHNGLMNICAVGAGAMMTVALGNMCGKVLEKTIDRIVDFWDDVNPNGPSQKKTRKDEDDG